MTTQPLLLDGQWIELAADRALFQPAAPATGDDLPEHYPVCAWDDLDRLLQAGARDAPILAQVAPDRLAAFLEGYATLIDDHAEELAAQAALETGHPVRSRYLETEIPRTLKQLRDAAACARDQNWTQPVIDTAANLRSHLAPLGRPVLVIGPNNFPFAYNGIAGGDFAAAIATGHPVIAKAHPAHPGTTLHLARLAQRAAQAAGLPPATVQLFYQCHNADGLRLAGDDRLGAIGFTGSEATGRQLKAAADAAGIPVYLEMSSINPVSLLPGALTERGASIAAEFSGSCLLGNGQFCTNPGLLLAIAGPATDIFLATAAAKFAAAPAGVMLTSTLAPQLDTNVATLTAAGAKLLARGAEPTAAGFRARAALLRVTGADFLAAPATFRTEMFGPASLVVVAADQPELLAIATQLASSLTASFYTATNGDDDALYNELFAILAPKAGRVLNDKMPTGVAVSPAMMHGGPFPAGGHPGFTAVGFPASLRRFGALRCYDNVRPERLPLTLRDQNPTGQLWRSIDGSWTQADVPASA